MGSETPVTLGIRSTTKIKDKFDDLAQEAAADNNSDFLETLMEVYQKSQQRESLSHVKELEDLRHHIERIEEIFISNVKAAKDRQEKYDQIISQAQEESRAAKASAHEAADLAKIQRQEANEEIKVSREQAETAWLELSKARERADSFERLANLAEAAAASADKRAADLECLASQTVELGKEIEMLTREREELTRGLSLAKEDMERMRVELQKSQEGHAGVIARLKETAKENIGRQADIHASEISRIKETHQAVIERLSEKGENEKERALLLAQRGYLDEINKLRDTLVDTRNEKAELAIRLASYKKDNG
ncbi:MAG: hypothetical protein ACYCX4_17420 [Bacillota bacterium]